MTEIRFYHLTTQNLEEALPVILTKALSSGKRAVVQFGNTQDVLKFDEILWTYKATSFLPHGTDKDSNPQNHPLFLTSKPENPNMADMLVLCNIQTVPENVSDFALVCDFLDGNDNNAVTHGRTRFKSYRDAGHTLTYWQQSDTGGWEQKA